MFCPKCGTQNPETGKFCRTCGTDLGNVSEALSGKSGSVSCGIGFQPMNLVNHKGKSVSWETAIGKIFTGIAFLIVSIILGVTGMAGAKVWWFWMLIPAFGALGSGVAQLIQLKKSEKQAVASFVPASRQNEVNSAPRTSALPPTQTEYVQPPQNSIYDTGELVVPPSVTEGTTRHLEINSEGETMTLPERK
jgi:hypothetical protein